MALIRSSTEWCPACPRKGYTYAAQTPEIRTCNFCGFIYCYRKDPPMPQCAKCDRGYTSCDCYPDKPKPGQWIKITRKFKSGLIETWEGPIHEVTWDDDPSIVRSVRIGSSDYRRHFILGTQESGMIEPGTWEVTTPAEPPNRSIWVTPGKDGKTQVWRRIQRPDSCVDQELCWFYPGSDVGYSWATVISKGYGYLLEVPNG